jgi:antibiotic biosynthesis monooxygenase (ABM) superfamily enzyme
MACPAPTFAEKKNVITIHLKYTIDPYKLEEFEDYAQRWIPLVNKFGGIHHGYFLPHEGANNVAFALFSFASLAAYETYREESEEDKECQKAYLFAQATQCIVSYERTFMKPLFSSYKN